MFIQKITLVLTRYLADHLSREAVQRGLEVGRWHRNRMEAAQQRPEVIPQTLEVAEERIEAGERRLEEDRTCETYYSSSCPLDMWNQFVLISKGRGSMD
jgi:hypothetical protein